MEPSGSKSIAELQGKLPLVHIFGALSMSLGVTGFGLAGVEI